MRPGVSVSSADASGSTMWHAVPVMSWSRRIARDLAQTRGRLGGGPSTLERKRGRALLNPPLKAWASFESSLQVTHERGAES